jgi:hypothetical protein
MPASESTPESTLIPTPNPIGTNPLTGLEMDPSLEGRRPVAIVYSNIRAALPQHGISEADIIYEVLMEGDITRMIGLHMDPYSIPTLGSIRSIRPYFLDVAQAHDAILVHSGYSTEARSEITRRGVTALDGGVNASSFFHRDADRLARRIAQEHTHFITGPRLRDAIAYLRVRQNVRDGYANAMRFDPDGTPEGGAPADRLTLRFSATKTGIFEYNAEDGLYYVSQFNATQIDGNTGAQLAVRNVLVLRVNIWTIAGDSAGRRRADLVTTGEGYFLCGGKWIPILWSRAAFDAPFVYTKADGTPLILGVGRTYINLFPRSYTVIIE